MDTIIGERADATDKTLESAHQCWANILQLFIQLKNTGETFLHLSSKVSLIIMLF